MLSVRNISKGFGGLRVLNRVSLEVKPQSVTGLVGPNGSGKTTLFNIISGLYPKDGGEIFFKGEKIDRLSPSARARKGLCRTFQVTKAPRKMTVLENMLLTAREQAGERVSRALFGWRKVCATEEANLERALKLLETVGLETLGNEYAANLSGGQKKLLALARALMANSELLLLDEPAAGVNPTLTVELLEVIRNLKKKGNTFFIKHNMKVISAICDMVYVLDSGEKIAEGTPEEIQRNEKVLRAYLSGKRSDAPDQSGKGM
jgi:neutral amino acid transport system ATP-binding protein